MYHVRTHAVWYAPLFTDENDYLFRLGQLAEAVRLGHLRCHFVCLMGTHEHLIVGVDDNRLAWVMQRLNRRYAANYNVRRHRRGRVYWAPYGSSLIDTDEYLVELVAYLALNPERAGLGHAESYRWSSYGDLIGTRTSMPFVDHTPILEVFGAGDEAIERIKQLVADRRVFRRRRAEGRL